MTTKKALGDNPLNWIGDKKAGKKKAAAKKEETTKYLLTLPKELHKRLKHDSFDMEITLGEHIINILQKSKK